MTPRNGIKRDQVGMSAGKMGFKILKAIYEHQMGSSGRSWLFLVEAVGKHCNRISVESFAHNPPPDRTKVLDLRLLREST